MTPDELLKRVAVTGLGAEDEDSILGVRRGTFHKGIADAHDGVSGHSVAWPSINEPPDVTRRIDKSAALVNSLFAREVGHAAFVRVPVGRSPF
jgi:hypothetical protein